MESIKLNLIPNGVNPVCHCSQYDNGRVIRVELFDGLTPYTLVSGDIVTLNVRKPDNTIVETTLTATQGNKYVDLVTTEQICACAGENLCDLTITNGSTVIGTLNFIMQVERDVLANGIPSQSVIEDLDALVEEAVGDNYYTKSEVDDALDLKADSSDVYTKSEVDDALDLKADKEDLLNIENCFDITEHKSLNLLDPDNVTTGYYWTDGWHESSSYVNTGLVEIERNKTYTFQIGESGIAINRQITSCRFIVFYGEDKTTVISSGTYVSEVSLPENAYYFIASFNFNSIADFINTKPCLVEGTIILDYIPYFEPYTDYILKDDCNNTDYIKEVILQSKKTKNGLIYTFDINSNNYISAENLQDMFNYSMQFRGAIQTFNGLVIAHGYQESYGGYLKITPSTFEYYIGTESNPRLSEPHNLTFKDYIAVRLDAKPNFSADLFIYTNGGVYSKTNIAWDVRKGQLSARSEGTNVLTGCVLSYNCKGWSTPIHLYGDSYFGVYSDKWTKYLTDYNMNDNNINAFPGRQSATALLIAKTVLANSDPEKIIWCLGMNDGDVDDSTVNTSWKNCVEELIQICNSRGIELILATIPNVATVNNKAKNNYVVNSGYRFIDFASAVGAYEDSIWYDDMLSNDGVHPSTQGAIALFNQAIADAPELMQ